MNRYDHEGIWTIAEIRRGKLVGVSFELLAWGRKLADKLNTTLSSVVLGSKVSRDELRELVERGADRVYLIDHEKLSVFIPDLQARILKKLVEDEKPEIIIASATTTGRTLMPYLASLLGTGLTADCTDLDVDPERRLLLQTRPAIGGNVMATIITPDHRPQMATVRPRSRRPLRREVNRRGEIIEVKIEIESLESKYKWLDFIPDETSESPIQEADVIIAGGKGMKDGKNFELLFELARLLNGAVGASRSAVDMGWIPYSHQIGLSGKTVSPRLYIAFGISGAVQHIAGMSSSELIVSINKDPDANIFRISDFGIIGDALEILPLMIRKIKNMVEGNDEVG
ncbi:MAG: electron transfer flavoprotein subunit alpha [Thermotoga sp.]|nr:MAG: electron transfer flavoprotein subunit alpha [Thermotoga sp.]